MPSQPPLLLRHHRPFIAFWLARIFTASGFQMLTVAIGWQLYSLTGNVLDLGLVGLIAGATGAFETVSLANFKEA